MSKKMKELPKFYNSLEETKKEIFSLLFQGVKKRKSNFHNLVLNTIDLQNKPEARTVVLRGFSEEDLTINVHTDSRSEKVKHLENNPFTCLVFYDEKKKIQLRVRGSTKLEKSKKESWEKLSNWSRRCYLTTIKPGELTKQPTSGFPEKFKSEAPSSNESESGLKNFTVIKILIDEIEWLYLASQGHRRANFEIHRNKSGIKIDSKWLVP